MGDSPRVVACPRPWRHWLLRGAIALAAVLVAVWGLPWIRAGRYLEEARGAMDRAELARAIELLEAAEKIQPTRALIQYQLAVACRRAGRLGPFQEHWRQASALQWSEDDLRIQQWLATAQTGNVPAVEPELMKIIERGASDDQAEQIYEALTQGHLAAFCIPDAVLCLDHWMSWRPDAPQARILRACIFESQADFVKAAAQYRAVLERWPAHREARLRLGDVLRQRGDLPEALQQFQAVVAANPDDSFALWGLGMVERPLGDLPQARLHLEAALQGELAPYHRGIATAELGRVLLDEGRNGEAVTTLSKALEYVPAEWPVHRALGTALARLGQTEKARYHQQMFARTRKQSDRMTEITKSLASTPYSADLRCEAGSILLEQGLNKEGVSWLKTALRYDPKHRKAHELLANYYAEAGEQRLAAEHRLAAASTPGAMPSSSDPRSP